MIECIKWKDRDKWTLRIVGTPAGDFYDIGFLEKVEYRNIIQQVVDISWQLRLREYHLTSYGSIKRDNYGQCWGWAPGPDNNPDDGYTVLLAHAETTKQYQDAYNLLTNRQGVPNV